MTAEGRTSLAALAEGDGWATWLGRPEESLRRASHALGGDAGWWLVDPVDATDLDDWLATLGEVAGVVVLLDRHTRDADAIADRHDVAVHAPASVAPGVEGDVDAPVEAFEGELADSGYRARPLVERRVWREAALVGADGTLVVPESLGTTTFFLGAGERLGVHPVRRLLPPRAALGDLEPERVLVGHGEPVTEDAAAALTDALAGSRRRAPGLYAHLLRDALPV